MKSGCSPPACTCAVLFFRHHAGELRGGEEVVHRDAFRERGPESRAADVLEAEPREEEDGGRFGDAGEC